MFYIQNLVQIDFIVTLKNGKNQIAAVNCFGKYAV